MDLSLLIVGLLARCGDSSTATAATRRFGRGQPGTPSAGNRGRARRRWAGSGCASDEIRVFSLTDATGTIWVRTAICRWALPGQTVDVRATVFPGIDLPLIGSTGAALMETRPAC